MSDNKEVQTLYKEVLRSDWYKAQATIEQQAAEIERHAEVVAVESGLRAKSERELAALRAQQPGVVLPEQWSKSFSECWPVEQDDPEGDWAVGTVMRDGDEIYCPVIMIEAAQYDAPGESEKIAKALVAILNPNTEVAHLKSSPASQAWMMPTAKQLEQALESVPSFHDLSAELIAPAMLEHLRDVISAGEYGDAYRGARDESLIWKRRALEAETTVREQDQIIENLGDSLNAENGPTLMGEPVIRAALTASAPRHGDDAHQMAIKELTALARELDDRSEGSWAAYKQTGEQSAQLSDLAEACAARARYLRKLAQDLAASTAGAQSVPDDSSRLCKLLGWMSSNVEEGWNEVCRIASVATYVSHEEARAYLDDLQECSAGLAAAPAPGKGGDSV
ncbi:hypothetical protein KLEP174_gp56 [Pseudomonas phage vB_PcuM_ KLEP17-4]|nr:hypothetical protein KLEP174_gp56 [Pseudomonas phage vB_PcuM_ KLEP17-4]